MPALLMRTSRRRYRSATSPTAASMLRALATSSARASTPPFASLLAAVCAFVLSRAVSSTTKSSSASCRQTSNPMPRLAPVTRATRTELACEGRRWAMMLFAFEEFLREEDGSHCIWPTRVERQMSDGFDQFHFSDSVLHGFPEMKTQLVRAI